VPWAKKGDDPVREPGEPIWLKQIWFAGCHSDIGGSYAEDESRLSDVTLNWMVEEATTLPLPMQVDGSKLHLFPDAGGMQHSEVQAMRELYPNWVPNKWRLVWKEHPRVEALGAPQHPSVDERFRLAAILDCGESKPYRPYSLRNEERFKALYLQIGDSQ
jgi:hypothetical protein